MAKHSLPKPCGHPGCPLNAVAKGLCSTHWTQQRRAYLRAVERGEASAPQPPIRMDMTLPATCFSCGVTKSPDEFPAAARRTCVACGGAKTLARRWEAAGRTSSRPPKAEDKIVGGITYRLCLTCGLTKPITDYDTSNSQPRRVCKSCARDRSHETDAARRRAAGVKVKWVRVVKILDGLEQQECRACHTWKPVGEFYLTHVPREPGRKRPDVVCKECVKAAGKARRETHPEPKRERQIDPAYWRAATRKRRAHKADAQINDLMPSEWDALVAAVGGRCIYCGDTPPILCQDHVVPISHGGNHTLANVVPACGSCNSSKVDRPVLEWLAWRAERRQRDLQRAIARLEIPLT